MEVRGGNKRPLQNSSLWALATAKSWGHQERGKERETKMLSSAFKFKRLRKDKDDFKLKKIRVGKEYKELTCDCSTKEC